MSRMMFNKEKKERNSFQAIYVLLNQPTDGQEIQFGNIEWLIKYLNDNLFLLQKDYKQYEPEITVDEIVAEFFLSNKQIFKIRDFFEIKIYLEKKEENNE